MTPKEKAKELVDKFRKYVDDGRHNGFYSGEITFENQKQCALIAVDEIIKSSPTIIGQMTGIKSNKKYWQKVKQEIELL